MAVKTKFLKDDFKKLLARFNLGNLKDAKPITQGAVQTNFFLETTKGKYVFRYYESRTKGSVLFEAEVISYLKNRGYPCPGLFKDRLGKSVGIHKGKPYIIFEFVEGRHIKNPSSNQRNQLIKKVAELHNLTKNYRPQNLKYRWNYSVELCKKLAQDVAKKISTGISKQKLKWLENVLLELELPKSLPKGVCHCDFHFSNVLFKNGKFNALIDFDDANYTYLMFDLVGLIESGAWRHDKDKTLNFIQAKKIISEYQKYRLLNKEEKLHLFDVYKLSILFDSVWYLGRGSATNFYERSKIKYLNSIGRERFYSKLYK